MSSKKYILHISDFFLNIASIFIGQITQKIHSITLRMKEMLFNKNIQLLHFRKQLLYSEIFDENIIHIFQNCNEQFYAKCYSIFSTSGTFGVHKALGLFYSDMEEGQIVEICIHKYK